MKKTIAILILLILSFQTVAFSENDNICIYVSKDSVNPQGTFDEPFATFEQARDYIRKLKTEGTVPKKGFTVYFRGGDYNLSHGLELDERDSGEDNAPVVYRAYGNEEVKFIGGIGFMLSEFSNVNDPKIIARLPSSSSKNVKCLNLKEKGITDYGEMSDFGSATKYFAASEGSIPYQSEQEPELFFNNEPMKIARYPNDDYTTTTGVADPGSYVAEWTNWIKGTSSYIPVEERGEWHPFAFKWEDDRLNNYKEADQIRIHGFWGTEWCDLACGVKSIDFEHKIVYSALTDAFQLKNASRFYFYNLLEEIDSPGEYFLDRNSGILYFYPVSDDGFVTMSTLGENILETKNAKNITFKGLSFTCGKKNGVYTERGKNINFELCSVSDVAAKGIEYQYTTDSHVTSCHVYNCGSGGIFHEMNDVISFNPSNMVIENNIVNNFSRLTKTYSEGVRTGGNYNKIIHNKIYDSPHLACVVSGHYNYIEYNEFFDCLKESDDCGVIYLGRSKQQRNNYIRNNYFHDLSNLSGTGRAAIYLDDGWDGVTIESNIFENMDVGVWVNGGRDNNVQNNVFTKIRVSDIRTSAILLQFYENNFQKFEADFKPVVTDKVQEREEYQDFEHFYNLLEDEPLVPKYNILKNNIEFDCEAQAKNITLLNLPASSAYSKDYIFSQNIYNNVFSFENDPGFQDVNAKNYCIKEDSKVYDVFEEFKAPDYKNMGIYTPWIERYSKDTVSFLEGSPIVYRGMTPCYTNDALTAVPFKENEKVYIPLRCLWDNLGGKTQYDSDENKAVFENGDTKLEIYLNDFSAKINGAKKDVSNDVKLVNSSLFMSMESLESVMDLHTKKYDNGVIFVKKGVINEDWKDYMVEDMKRRLENQ